MPNMATILRGLHWEDSDLVLMARIKGLDGALIEQDSLMSITARVYDAADNSTIGATLVLAVADTVFDTLQASDSRWTVDAAGYNFRCTIPAVYFPAGHAQERIEVIFQPMVGASFPFVVELQVENLLSS